MAQAQRMLESPKLDQADLEIGTPLLDKIWRGETYSMYSRTSLMCTPKGRTKSVHISKVSPVVKLTWLEYIECRLI